ncbi:hypothetical protein [Shewanella colwelliana]|uniref:hypothetical protein n=1 Tax=Shewanella colwelliana TaxID=23 RepID=UPI003735C88B
MKIIHALLLSLALLATAAQADTTLFGLTLGKSTLEEVQQRYTLKWKKSQSSLPDTWSYYRVSGEQFAPKADLRHAVLYFDDQQVLGTVRFRFPISLTTYKALKQQISEQYPRAMTPYFKADQYLLERADFESDTTHVTIEHSDYFTDLTYTDLNYRATAQKIIAENKANKANKDATP